MQAANQIEFCFEYDNRNPHSQHDHTVTGLVYRVRLDWYSVTEIITSDI